MNGLKNVRRARATGEVLLDVERVSPTSADEAVTLTLEVEISAGIAEDFGHRIAINGRALPVSDDLHVELTDAERAVAQAKWQLARAEERAFGDLHAEAA